jgi:hypothetical protein
MRGHLLRVLKQAAVLEIDRGAGCPEGVTTDGSGTTMSTRTVLVEHAAATPTP